MIFCKFCDRDVEPEDRVTIEDIDQARNNVEIFVVLSCPYCFSELYNGYGDIELFESF